MKAEWTIKIDTIDDGPIEDCLMPHIQGQEWKFAVSDILGFLRTKYKYTDETTITIDEMRAKIVEILDDHELKVF